MKRTLLSLALALPVAAFGHGSVFESTELAVSAALERFQQEAPSNYIEAYRGVRAWPSGAKIMVRVYHHDKDSVLYTCIMDHDTGAEERMSCE